MHPRAFDQYIDSHQFNANTHSPPHHDQNNNFTVLRNNISKVDICRVPYGNNNHRTIDHLHDIYTDVRHWDGFIDSIDRIGGPQDPDCQTAIFKSNMEQEEIEEE